LQIGQEDVFFNFPVPQENKKNTEKKNKEET